MEKRLFNVSRIVSYLVGIGFNLFILLVVSLLPDFFGEYISSKTMLSFISIAYFGLAGIHYIDPAHRAVLLFFGGRLEHYAVHMNEGWVWILPFPIMGLIEVDTRHFPLELDDVEVITRDKIKVRISKASITWRVDNPDASIGVGLGVIATNLQDLVLREIRDHCAQMVALTSREEDTAGVSTSDLVRSGRDLVNRIEKAADEVAADWGIDVVRVTIPQILVPESLLDATVRFQTERAERDAEKQEIQTIRALIEELRVTFPNTTDEELIALVQSERGKIDRLRIDVKGETSIERAAGMVLAGLRGNGKGNANKDKGK